MTQEILIMLKEQGISQKELAKRLNIAESTLCKKMKFDNWRENDLRHIAEVCGCKCECKFIVKQENASVHQFKKIDFDVFKSNICHDLKSAGDIAFIQQTLNEKKIDKYFVQKQYPESLYLLAMVDYLCRINNIAKPAKYNPLRKTRLKKPLLPKSIMFLQIFSANKNITQEAIDNAIPEFKKFNIIESDIRNVI